MGDNQMRHDLASILSTPYEIAENFGKNKYFVVLITDDDILYWHGTDKVTNEAPHNDYISHIILDSNELCDFRTFKYAKYAYVSTSHHLTVLPSSIEHLICDDIICASHLVNLTTCICSIDGIWLSPKAPITRLKMHAEDFSYSIFHNVLHLCLFGDYTVDLDKMKFESLTLYGTNVPDFTILQCDKLLVNNMQRSTKLATNAIQIFILESDIPGLVAPNCSYLTIVNSICPDVIAPSLKVVDKYRSFIDTRWLDMKQIHVTELESPEEIV